MNYVLIMLKRISPQDPLDHPIPKPTVAAVGTTSAQPEPLAAPLDQPELDVATVPPKTDPEPPVATSKKKKKKTKNNQFFCVFF